jgi:hypothetical protein
VTNRVLTALTLKDNKIIEHRDHFNLHRWASQAAGITGFLLGWSHYFQRKLQRQTKSWLQKFMDKRA